MPRLTVKRGDGAVMVLHPDHGAHVVLRAGDTYPDDDPLVKEYPWAFGTAEEIEAEALAEPVTSVEIEAATAAPGEKRSTRRPR